jgi:MscS family membrane protein
MVISFQFHHFIENKLTNHQILRLLFFPWWILFASSALAFGQADLVDSSRVALENPYQTVYTHLEYLSDNNYHPEISSQAFIQEGVDAKQARTAAIKLKQILDGEGIYLEMDDIPRDPNYLDSATNRHRYILTSRHPEIYLDKKGNKWIYS